MDPILLNDSETGSTAQVAAHLGFNCYSFQAMLGGRRIDVLDSAPDFDAGGQRPSHHGIPLLFPYPNRIRGGRYTWNGQDYEIPESSAMSDGNGNAIHGFCLDRPWRVVANDDQHVIGQFQLSLDAPHRLKLWPADCFIEVRYTLLGSTLRADVRVANPGDAPLPWGFGTHPYFRLPLVADSDPKRCLVQVPATEQWELIDCLPTGTRKPLSSENELVEGAYFDQLQLDDVLSGLQSESGIVECVIIDEQAGLQIAQRSSPVFRELVAYTPAGRNAVCLEPYTCVTDAINLQQQGIDAGLQVLEPGDELRTWFEISAEPVIA